MQARTIVLAAALGLGLGAGAAAQTMVMPRSKVTPALHAQVTLGQDRNANTTVVLEVRHMAQPSSLTPPYRYYVVWVRDTRRTAPAGVLRVGGNLEGELKFVVPQHRFTLLVTGENERDPEAPGPTVVVEGALARAQ